VPHTRLFSLAPHHTTTTDTTTTTTRF